MSKNEIFVEKAYNFFKQKKVTFKAFNDSNNFYKDFILITELITLY